MSYNANVKLIYTNNSDSSPSQYFPEMVDQQTIVIEAPAQDLNVHQYFSLFKSFLRAIDFNEYSIIDGAARLAFNDCNDQAQMQKLMNEYDLQDKQAYTDDECRALENEVRDLKAKLSRYEQPDNPQYTDDEISAMTAEVLRNAEVVCKDCGSKYGTYSVGCSSTWEGECGVCGETKGVTEVRDYGYLSKGIKELSK